MAKRKAWLLLLVFFAVSVTTLNAYAEESAIPGPSGQGAAARKENETGVHTVTGCGSIWYYSQYVSRGYEIGRRGLLIQPSVSVAYNGFSLAVWGNIDGDQRDTTSASFRHKGSAGWNETDLTLSYTHTIDRLSLTGGYVYYVTAYADETAEFFATIAYDVIAKPTLSVYQDVRSYPGTYVNLSFAHSVPLGKGTTLDLGVAFGYEIGEGDFWRTFQPATGDYTGKRYQGCQDGVVKAGLTVALAKALSIQPVVQYWFPLSNNARKTYGTSPETGLKIPFNPNGNVSDNLVYSMGLTYSF